MFSGNRLLNTALQIDRYRVGVAAFSTGFPGRNADIPNGERAGWSDMIEATVIGWKRCAFWSLRMKRGLPNWCAPD
jgi:hypothetical protein